MIETKKGHQSTCLYINFLILKPASFNAFLATWSSDFLSWLLGRLVAHFRWVWSNSTSSTAVQYSIHSSTGGGKVRTSNWFFLASLTWQPAFCRSYAHVASVRHSRFQQLYAQKSPSVKLTLLLQPRSLSWVDLRIISKWALLVFQI